MRFLRSLLAWEEGGGRGVAVLGWAPLHHPSSLGHGVESLGELRRILHLRVDLAKTEAQTASILRFAISDPLAASSRSLAGLYTLRRNIQSRLWLRARVFGLRRQVQLLPRELGISVRHVGVALLPILILCTVLVDRETRVHEVALLVERSVLRANLPMASLHRLRTVLIPVLLVRRQHLDVELLIFTFGIVSYSWALPLNCGTV